MPFQRRGGFGAVLLPCRDLPLQVGGALLVAGNVAPEVDNNWKIVGVDLQETNPDRATLIALVNQGKIDAPYSKSLNLNDPAVQEILNDKSNAALRNWNRVKMFFTTK